MTWFDQPESVSRPPADVALPVHAARVRSRDDCGYRSGHHWLLRGVAPFCVCGSRIFRDWIRWSCGGGARRDRPDLRSSSWFNHGRVGDSRAGSSRQESRYPNRHRPRILARPGSLVHQPIHRLRDGGLLHPVRARYSASAAAVSSLRCSSVW